MYHLLYDRQHRHNRVTQYKARTVGYTKEAGSHRRNIESNAEGGKRMNICIVSGKIQQRPVLIGDGKAMKFTISTRYLYGTTERKEGYASVPCTVFNPSDSLKQFLSSEEVKYCKGVGRVHRSSYEDKEGKKIYATEVVLNPESIMVRTG